MDPVSKTAPVEKVWVRESKFGRWFLTTDIWFQYVWREAVVDFHKLLSTNLPESSHFLDVGCHQGMAFALLEQYFHPKTIIGIDIDQELLEPARQVAKRCQCLATCVHGTVYNLAIPDNSVDVVFCHQLLHHLSDQVSALQELYRVLAPGGVLLSGESCRSLFIHSPYVSCFVTPKMYKSQLKNMSNSLNQ